MNPLVWWLHLWHQHGTKVLGFGTAAVGALEYVDHATLQLVETTLGPKYGPMVSRGISIGAGLMVARRGYRNSNPPPPR